MGQFNSIDGCFIEKCCVGSDATRRVKCCTTGVTSQPFCWPLYLLHENNFWGNAAWWATWVSRYYFDWCYTLWYGGINVFPFERNRLISDLLDHLCWKINRKQDHMYAAGHHICLKTSGWLSQKQLFWHHVQQRPEYCGVSSHRSIQDNTEGQEGIPGVDLLVCVVVGQQILPSHATRCHPASGSCTNPNTSWSN